METDELIRKCSAIMLEEEKEDRVMYGGNMKAKGIKIAVGCLVGKILTTRGISHEGGKRSITTSMAPSGVSKGRKSAAKNLRV